MRTLTRAETTDNSTGIVRYPSTPSRIELSLWPAGISSEPEGTVEWAGGMINWQDPDYVSAGHFYALIQSINITCADPTTEPSDATSYVYGKNSSTFTPSVAFSNLTTINGAVGSLNSVQGVMGLWTVLGAAVFSLVGAALV